jgi:hypothetical protein
MNAVPYRSIDGLCFGATQEDAENIFGSGLFSKQNRDGELEVHFDDKVLRFSASDGRFRECTIPRGVELLLDGVPVDWSSSSLVELCRMDGAPFEYFGTIVLFNLGIAVTGLAQEEESDRSLTFFRRGDWDELRSDMKPLDLSGLIASH